MRGSGGLGGAPANHFMAFDDDSYASEYGGGGRYGGGGGGSTIPEDSTLVITLMSKRGGLASDQAIGKLEFSIPPANLDDDGDEEAPAAAASNSVSSASSSSPMPTTFSRYSTKPAPSPFLELDRPLCHLEWFPLTAIKSDLVMAELNVTVAAVGSMRRLPSDLARFRCARRGWADHVAGLEAVTCSALSAELRLSRDLQRHAAAGQ